MLLFFSYKNRYRFYGTTRCCVLYSYKSLFITTSCFYNCIKLNKGADAPHYKFIFFFFYLHDAYAVLHLGPFHLEMGKELYKFFYFGLTPCLPLGFPICISAATTSRIIDSSNKYTLLVFVR